jgi:hypothetical protein
MTQPSRLLTEYTGITIIISQLIASEQQVYVHFLKPDSILFSTTIIIAFFEAVIKNFFQNVFKLFHPTRILCIEIQ